MGSAPVDFGPGNIKKPVKYCHVCPMT
nr:unnamed protein product [Callosobruchus chinensis]